MAGSVAHNFGVSFTHPSCGCRSWVCLSVLQVQVQLQLQALALTISEGGVMILARGVAHNWVSFRVEAAEAFSDFSARRAGEKKIARIIL